VPEYEGYSQETIILVSNTEFGMGLLSRAFVEHDLYSQTCSFLWIPSLVV